MANVPTRIPSLSSSSRYVKTIPELSGGYVRADHSESLSDNQLSELCNMFFHDGKLCSRFGITAIPLGESITGAFHSMTEETFEGSVVFHLGKGIFRFDGKEVTLLYDSFSDVDSICFAMNNTVYFFARDYKIVEVSSTFEAKETQAYAPTIIKNSNNDVSSYETKEAFNMLCPRVRVSYVASYEKYYYLPYDRDKRYPVHIYLKGSDTPINAIMSSNRRFCISLDDDDGVNSGEIVTVEFTPVIEGTAFENYCEKIFGCTLAICYGGTSDKGTRVLLTGNEKYPGSYYMSELLNPLYFTDTQEGVVGHGNENITAIHKRYGKLFFFTRKQIYSMSYSFDSEEGADFSLAEISSIMGCDIPESVQLIDNSLVFANISSGISILCSTDNFDELNIKPLSANVLNSSLAFPDTAPSASCDFDRKYFLAYGKDIYVWDYGRTAYYETGDYFKAQRRLAFFKFNGFGECKKLFSLGGSLYAFTADENTQLLKYDKEALVDSLPDGHETKSCCTTKEFDFDLPFCKKKLEYIVFGAESYGGGAVTVTLFADGKEYYSKKLHPGKSNQKFKLKLPQYPADLFKVKFEMCGGRMSLSGISLAYLPVDNIKNY